MKARKLGVMAPVVYLVDFKTRVIYMEHIAGKVMKDVLSPAEINLAGDLMMPASRQCFDLKIMAVLFTTSSANPAIWLSTACTFRCWCPCHLTQSP